MRVKQMRQKAVLIFSNNTPLPCGFERFEGRRWPDLSGTGRHCLRTVRAGRTLFIRQLIEIPGHLILHVGGSIRR